MESPLTIKEVSEMLNICPTTAYRLVRRNQIPHFRVGDAIRFSPRILEEWMVSAQVNLGRAGK